MTTEDQVRGLMRRRKEENLYHPMEHAILAEYFKRPDLLPDIVKGTDPYRPVDTQTWDESLQGIGPHSSWSEKYKIENAVARICLSSVQDRLPQWFSIKCNGEMIFGRTQQPVHRRLGILQPKFLFILNLAEVDAVPGLSWRESYYVTFLPYYDVHVVTVSSDGDAYYGYPDIAIGFGTKDVPVQDTIRKAIARFWATTTQDKPGAWECVLIEEMVDEGTAHRWLRRKRQEEKGP